jgi:hypothetical protein
LISVDLKKRLIPDEDTFINLGYDFDNVRGIPTTVMNKIPEGLPFISTSTKPPKKVSTKKKNIALRL